MERNTARSDAGLGFKVWDLGFGDQVVGFGIEGPVAKFPILMVKGSI